jgi:acyl carrier protein
VTDAEVASKVLEIVGRTLGVDAAKLDRSMTASDIDGWDSLAHATILIRLEKSFDLDLDREAANAAPNLGALIDVVRSAIHD